MSGIVLPNLEQRISMQQEMIQSAINECAMRAYIALIDKRRSPGVVGVPNHDEKKEIAREAIDWSVAFVEELFNVKAQRKEKRES